MNTNAPAWNILPAAPAATFSITDLTGGTFPSIVGAQTSGYLQVQSPTSGAASSVSLTGTQTTAFLGLINPPSGAQLLTAVQGTLAGLQNAPVTPATQRERLLSHLIFSPVLKTANRTLAITYTITISVARSTT
jgi:CBS-domain-containing membrane protein